MQASWCRLSISTKHASKLESPMSKKTVNDLKVVELRNELEKRGLEKTGCKAALVERLSKVLEEDGEDPSTYEFELSSDVNASKPSGHVVEESSGEQGSMEEVEELEEGEEEEEEEKEEEEKDESIDPDALQLSIEDEEKLLNEEEESYEKARDDTQAEEDTSAKDVSETSGPGEEKSGAVEEGTGDNTDTSLKKDGEAREDTPTKKTKSAATTPGKDAAKPAGKLAKDGTKRVVVSPSSGRNIWVSGLSSSTRAADLKALFSKHGKVVSAKIVTNARTPGARCYGFITMGTLDQATKCIQHLHRTELHGKMISVERTKQEPGAALKKSEAKTNLALKAKAAAEVPATPAASTEVKSEVTTAKPVPAKKKTTLASAAAVPKKKVVVKATGKQKTSETAKKVVKKDVISEDDLVVIDEKTDKDDAAKDKPREKRATRDRSRGHSRDRRPHGRSREQPPFVRRRFARPFYDRGMVRGSRFFRRATTFFRRTASTPFFRGRGGFRSSFGMQPRPSLTDTLTFRKIKEEHMRTREREEERRSFQESLRQKELERRQREEAFRLEREREHLRIEREKLEREKLEVIRLEREKQRLERERIQREREELRQRQLMAGRAVEERAEPARRMKRPVAPERREDDAYWAEKKRSHSRPDYPSSAAVPAKLPPPPPPQQSRSADRLDHHFSSSHHHSSHHSSHHRHHNTPPSNIPSASGSMFSSSSRPAEYRSGPPAGGAPPSRRSGPPVRSEWRQVSDSAPPRREHRFSDSDAGKAYGGSSSSSRSFPSSWSKPSFSSSQSWDARKDSAWNGSGEDGRWRTGASGSGGSGYGGGGVSNGTLGSHGSSGNFGERFSSSSRRY